jgi:general secretion pathway protein M
MQLSDFKQQMETRFEPLLVAARPWIDKVLERWEELNEREQMVLRLLAGTIVLALILVFFVAPVLKQREKAQTLFETKRETLEWMREVAPKVKGMGSSGQTTNAQSMMNTVNGTAASFQLSLDRVQPEGDSKLRVWLQNASFNTVMRWLNDLQINSGIVASSVNIDAESQPGLVSVKVVLQGQ